MRPLIIGASGLIGGALKRLVGPLGVGTYYRNPARGLIQLDMRDDEAVAVLFRDVRPAVVYLPAAQPHVDECESDPRESYSVNVVGTRTVVERAREVGARLVFFSSDYVFNGRDGPYREQNSPDPVNVYGSHKLEAERAVLAASDANLVVRVCGVYGYEARGKNFVMSFVRRVRSGQVVRVPSDQWGNPTYVEDLARTVLMLVAAGCARIWHVAAREYLTRAEFARRICKAFDLPPDSFEAVPTAALGQLALRPYRGGLVCAHIREYLPHLKLRSVARGLRATRAMWEKQEGYNPGPTN